MASGKKYTSLLDLPGTPIERCSQVLANRMQCWRAGDVLVEEEVTPPPAEPPPGKLEHPPIKSEAKATPQAEPPATRSYQLCQMHATINKRADEALAKQGPPKEGEKSPLDKMLGVELRYRTTVPPVAKEEFRREEVKTQAEKDFDTMMAEPSEQPQAQTKHADATSSKK